MTLINIDELRATSHDQPMWREGALPALYLSHGAPPLLEDHEWARALHAWAQSMPKPRGIVIVSAHWEAAPASISATAAGTPLVYDFGGFAPIFYSLEYSTPDATWLGDLVASVLPNTETVHRHTTRGLDHGAWIPLMVMYPWADVPVVQVSLPTHQPDRLLALGAALGQLRDQGIMIIGSGFMTHGLPFLTREEFGGYAIPGWSIDFDEWASEALRAKDVEMLARYREAPGMPYAHPSVEHFSPLFVTLGASNLGTESIDVTVDGYKWGLSRKSFAVA